jgi:hypothetical protein
MYQIESKCIRLNPILANCFKMFSNASISIQMYPIVSKYIQKLNLTFKAINKDNTIDYTIENLLMLIIKERITKTTSEK